MVSKIEALFSSEIGAKIYSEASAFIDKHGMARHISGGALVGLSGGADSVMLLCFLKKYAEDRRLPSPVAVHINHLIRGDEADADEALALSVAEGLGIEFISFSIDVPTIARTSGLGLEECAREVRYSKFSEIISGREDISSVAIAHNKDDNAETVILNLMRGSGTRGAAGIPPVRGEIFRPLLSVSKRDIVTALDSACIPYAVDSTNLSVDYDRNYIRHEIIPRLARLGRDPGEQLMRLSENLRSDDAYLSSLAEEALCGGAVTSKGLAALHPSVGARVIMKMAAELGVSVSAKQIAAILAILPGENFSYSLGKGFSFVAERGVCRVIRDTDPDDYLFKVDVGINVLDGYCAELLITQGKPDKSSLFVYKKSIQANLSSAIINGSLLIRPKRDGDTIYYGKMTRKLKKLFNDRGIPKSMRNTIPLLCDDSGVLWIPGLGVRDDGVKNSESDTLYVTLGLGRSDGEIDSVLHGADDFK